MMRLNNGIWIAFGTLSLFCMSYLGAYQVITSPHLENMRSKFKVLIQQRKHVHKQSRQLKKACLAHSQEESFLRSRVAELESENQDMYKQSIDSKELIQFYETVTTLGVENNLKTTSMESETIQLKSGAILNLTLNIEGPMSNLLIWIQSLETTDYPLVINHYSMTKEKTGEDLYTNLAIQLSLLVEE